MSEEIESIEDKLNLGPLAYAIASIFMVPIMVVLTLLVAVLMLLCWPIMPFVAYNERKKELQDEQEEDE
jgi:hypothetical protein